MLEHIKCNLCDTDAYDVLYAATLDKDEILHPDNLACTNLGHGRYHRIVRCRNCGLIYSNPRDKADYLEDFYKKVKDHVYNEASLARIKTFNRVLSCLERFKSGSKLLDVGCYTGLFMDVAHKRGWDVFGVEPSSWAAVIARGQNKHKAINCSIFDLDRINDKFDAVTMWDVLEHLTNPRLALEICREKIHQDGIIALSTMRCQGLFYKLCSRRWPWFMRMHLYYFTEGTISKMLERVGFRLIHIRPYVHYVSLDYLLYKLKIINGKFSFHLKNSMLRKFVLPVQLGDFMEVYACKK